MRITYTSLLTDDYTRTLLILTFVFKKHFYAFLVLLFSNVYCIFYLYCTWRINFVISKLFSGHMHSTNWNSGEQIPHPLADHWPPLHLLSNDDNHIFGQFFRQLMPLPAPDAQIKTIKRDEWPILTICISKNPSDAANTIKLVTITSIFIRHAGSTTYTHTYTHTHLTALFRDYPGEPVPER